MRMQEHPSYHRLMRLAAHSEKKPVRIEPIDLTGVVDQEVLKETDPCSTTMQGEFGALFDER